MNPLLILRRSTLTFLVTLGMLVPACPVIEEHYDSTESIDRFWTNERIAQAVPLVSDSEDQESEFLARAASLSRSVSTAESAVAQEPASSPTGQGSQGGNVAAVTESAPVAPSPVAAPVTAAPAEGTQGEAAEEAEAPDVAAASSAAPVAAAVPTVAPVASAPAVARPLPDGVGAPGVGVNFTGFPQLGTFFYTDKAGTAMHSCGGTVISTKSRSIVLTAAHCFDGLNPEKFLFIPMWSMIGSKSVEPFGRFFLQPGGIIYYPEYTDANAHAHLDLALMRIAPRDGRTVGDIVGSLPVTLNASKQQARVDIYGYPASAVEGAVTTMPRKCFNSTPSTLGNDSSPVLPFSLVIGCTGYPGGVSGGPWIVSSGGRRSVIAISSGEVVDRTSAHTTIGLNFGTNLTNLLARIGDSLT